MGCFCRNLWWKRPAQNHHRFILVSSGTIRKRRRNIASGKRVNSSGLSEVLTEESMREQLLADALEELELFRSKYRRLKELAGVFAAIQKVKRK